MNDDAHKLKRRQVLSLGAAAAISALPGAAAADTFPSRPLRMVVPFPPGGPTDMMSRAIAERMSRSLGQPVVVDNRAGAGGIIGATAVARAPKDGYTFGFIGTGILGVSPHMSKEITWDPIKDFAPITMASVIPLVLVVNPAQVPATSVAELVRYLRANKGKFSYGSDGVASITHLVAEMFNKDNDLGLVHVPYKGTAAIMQDLLGGTIQMSISGIAGPLPFVKEGRLRALANTGRTRSPALPDVPTLMEQGYNVDASVWFGLFAAGGTPAPVIATLNEHAVRALKDPALIEAFRASGTEATTSTPQELATTVEQNLAMWRDTIRKANVSVQ